MMAMCWTWKRAATRARMPTGRAGGTRLSPPTTSGLTRAGVNTDFGGSSPDAQGYQAFGNIGKVYSFWKNTFDRDSYDGDGEDIQMYIHVGSNWAQRPLPIGMRYL